MIRGSTGVFKRKTSLICWRRHFATTVTKLGRRT